MRLSYLGWCCAKGCREEATKSAAIAIGERVDLLAPVCDEHLAGVQAEVNDMRGHSLAVVIEEDQR